MKDYFLPLLKSTLDKVGLTNYATYVHSTHYRNFNAELIKRYWSLKRNKPEDGQPIPSMYLIYLVIGNPDPDLYLQSGINQVEKLLIPMLEKNNLDITKFGSLLDFGCGCGRLIRHLADAKDVELWGTDYNSILIDWCKNNLKFANFKTNDLNPPLPFEGAKFDFLYARSVFTHLSDNTQRAWLDEINRVLKPKGYFWFTVMGDNFKKIMTAEELRAFDKGDLVARYEDVEGENKCAVFHPKTYVESTWREHGFEIIDFLSGNAVELARQDTYLARKL